LKITELFSLEELELELQDGFVKEQKHPTLPLTILNYTDKATYERRWNSVTMHCRGLIVNNVTNDVVARGPRKFFNYGEPSASTYPLDTQVRLTTKHDGSLGIIWGYWDDEADVGDWGYATRGSFTSEQALHATANMHEVIPDSIPQWQQRNTTAIDEIVYPGNRIVLDYGALDANLPLGEVDNKSGLIIWRPLSTLVEGKPAFMSLAEAIALPIPDDEEGYVLDILDEYLNVVDHLKLKGDRYKELHAAIFGLSERAVWEQMQAGTINEFLEALPDEVQGWAGDVCNRLWKEHDALWWRVLAAHSGLYTGLQLGFSRKDAALYLKQNYPDVMSPVFSLLDGKEERKAEWLWNQIKPGHVPFSATKPLESASI
jgi:RNA ligase